jgi:hypothetical protein
MYNAVQGAARRYVSSALLKSSFDPDDPLDAARVDECCATRSRLPLLIFEQVPEILIVDVMRTGKRPSDSGPTITPYSPLKCTAFKPWSKHVSPLAKEGCELGCLKRAAMSLGQTLNWLRDSFSCHVFVFNFDPSHFPGSSAFSALFGGTQLIFESVLAMRQLLVQRYARAPCGRK